MSNVIQFLERLGADASLRYASPSDVARAADAASIDGPIRDVIATGQVERLGALLGARANPCCIVAVPADEGDDEDDGDTK